MPRRVVIGGGLFGCYAALTLARQGHSVLIIESANDIMTRASYCNQARLHTGLHYPRSFLTATESLNSYKMFREFFPTSVRDFEQIYAVSSRNSKTSGLEFEQFISRLGLNAERVNPNRWFNGDTVSDAFRVQEPTFDSVILRGLISEELSRSKNIDVILNQAIIGGRAEEDGFSLILSNGTSIRTEGVIIATYAGTNAVRGVFGLDPLPLVFELTEVILGKVKDHIRDIGITVMDGSFWSLMPFGYTDLVSLTSVGLTPRESSKNMPVFRCQAKRVDCTPLRLADCNTCAVRPHSIVEHAMQGMSQFFKYADSFTPTQNLIVVKTVLASTELDDARPTLIQKDPFLNLWTILSGKISTLFDLDGVLT